MKNKYKDVYPPYLPFPYFIYLRIRKELRQWKTRREEKAARKAGPVGIVDDGESNYQDNPTNPIDHINKAAWWMDDDLALPEIKKITDGIEEIKKRLTQKELKYTATAASFIPRMYTDHTEKKNAWCCHHSGVKSGDKVLDIGGASTAFNFYLADQGCTVRIVDNDWNNCGIIYNTNYVAKKMKWDIEAIDLDAGKPLPFPDETFDRVFSICVIEHIPSAGRRALMKEINRVLKPGGIASFSTDYDHGREVLIFDCGLRFAYRQKLEEDVFKPSGMKLMGNQEFIDTYPDKNFLGAFFLKKD